MWVDNTVAYNAHYTLMIVSNVLLCGIIETEDYEQIKIFRNCRGSYLPSFAALLCEIETHTENKQPRRIDLVYPENRNFPVPHAICSDEQVTLSFLPCHGSSQESLVTSDIGLGSSRASSAIDLDAPAFQCSNSVQYVPYTFLCDHRKDCTTDNSDEEFCHFPRCSGNTPLQCGTSNQVMS